jgi:hypothetical protein
MRKTPHLMHFVKYPAESHYFVLSGGIIFQPCKSLIKEIIALILYLIKDTHAFR